MRGTVKRTIAAACLCLASFAQSVAAQDLAALDRAEAALVGVWEQMPLSFRNVTFVDGDPAGYGIYRARANAVFGPGEQILVYAEPLGYGWQANPDGTYSFGFEVDVFILDSNRQVLLGQENFERLEMVSRHRNREFMLTLLLNLSGAPAGEYFLEYRVRDLAQGKDGTFSLPFRLAER